MKRLTKLTRVRRELPEISIFFKVTTRDILCKAKKFASWNDQCNELNIIENYWGNLARAVCQNGKQFVNIDELKKRIVEV